MRIRTFLHTLVATCTFLVAAHASAAAVLLVDANGVLTGANNVSVDGTLYNVSFGDGSCNSLFNNCAASSFAFNTSAAALKASQALLDQVLLDGPLGKFDTVTDKIKGCTYSGYCTVFTPYSTDGEVVLVAGAMNLSSAFNNTDSTGVTRWLNTWDLIGNTDDTYARFTLATLDASVPEPGSLALLGLALGALALKRRRAV